jgi:hypothetical protein
MHFLMPWLEVEATAEKMTNLCEVRRCIRVDGRDDKRPTARFSAAVSTECEVWRLRRLCNTNLSESILWARRSGPGIGCGRRFITIWCELHARSDVNRPRVRLREREFE